MLDHLYFLLNTLKKEKNKTLKTLETNVKHSFFRHALKL